MSNRANMIGVVAFVAVLVVMDAVVLTLPKYQRRHREQVAKNNRAEHLNAFKSDYQQAVLAASRNQQQEFSRAQGAAMSEIITMQDLTTEANDFRGEGGRIFHLTSRCLNRVFWFHNQIRDERRKNPALPLPAPIPPNIESCLSLESL